MTVLTGEGRVTILYGSQALPTPPYRSVYLARPDLEGRYPAVVVAHGATGLTPSVKAACRHLARFGYIGVAADLHRGARSGVEHAHGDLGIVVEALREDWHDWAEPGALAFLGLGEGGLVASRLAAAHDGALVLMGGTGMVDPEALGESGGWLLALMATDDADRVKRFHESVGRGQWVRYGDVGPGFYDEGSPDYHAPSAGDAYERIVGFLDRHLASRAMR